VTPTTPLIKENLSESGSNEHLRTPPSKVSLKIGSSPYRKELSKGSAKRNALVALENVQKQSKIEDSG